MNYTFEFVSKNKVVAKNGLKKETMDLEKYDLFRQMKSYESRLKLIPPVYYRFLTQQYSVNDHKPDVNYWESVIKPKLSTKMNKCLLPYQRIAIYKITLLFRNVYK